MERKREGKWRRKMEKENGWESEAGMGRDGLGRGSYHAVGEEPQPTRPDGSTPLL